MERLPAVAGWHWIKYGFALFRRQPSEMLTLFVVYCCLRLILSVNLVLGLVSLLVLTPPFSMAFMFACSDIEHGVRVHPRVLFAGFRRPTVYRLLGLGACYVIAMLAACLVTYFADDGYLWQAFINVLNDVEPPDAKTAEDARMAGSILVLVGTYLTATLPLWFATPLIAWRNMSVGKAIFFSFFSVFRAIKALALYAICWFFIIVLLNTIVSTVLQLIGLNIDAGLFVLMPMFILLSVVMYCSYYASYIQIFGAPEQPEPSEESLS
jgi:hypothetical protein